MSFKREQHISDDGEIKSSRTIAMRDKFDIERGYFLYSNGQTINGKSGVFFPNELNKMDIANLAILSRCLVKNVNMIGYRGNKNIVRPMKVKDMSLSLEMSERHTYRFLKKMMDLGMMAKVVVEQEQKQDVQYYMNPIYFLNGRNLNDNLYWLFNKYLDQHLPDWVINEFRSRKE